VPEEVLLAVDAGNSQVHAGVFRGEALVASWRRDTAPGATAAALAGELRGALAEQRIDAAALAGAAIASTVPGVGEAYLEAARAAGVRGRLHAVAPGADVGLPLRVEAPAAVGPDRLANAVAAGTLYGRPAIVVDLGTATNFDVVARDGAFVGGAIAPGLAVSARALSAAAARLPTVVLDGPARAIGTNTEANMRSGLVLGFAGLVDGLVGRMRDELAVDAPAIATGGLSGVVAPHCRTLTALDGALTLRGLRLIWLGARA
jgi:type III pantothenate kinase